MNMGTYVDPNSGAAPQPGGFAGAEGAKKGFAMGEGVEVEEEYVLSEYAPEPGAVVEADEEPEVEDDSVEEEPEVEEEVVEDDEPVEEESDEESDETADEEETGGYNPSEYSVDEVLAYVDAYPDERDAVLQAEKAGKNRKGIVDKLSD